MPLIDVVGYFDPPGIETNSAEFFDPSIQISFYQELHGQSFCRLARRISPMPMQRADNLA
jgi:hypothetical protein